MNNLDEIRKEINKCDEELISLFKKRMSLAKEVANYKFEHDLPIFDKERETKLIEKNIKLLNDKKLESYYLEWFNTMLKVSKDYQASIIKELK